MSSESDCCIFVICSGSVVGYILTIESRWGICFVFDCVKSFTNLDDPRFEFWGQNSFLGGVDVISQNFGVF
ncbi:hypothetical protein SLEP1_g31563 [Rubroshorea leprosula]|uniref:Uncharacterized protein n=1 Tax=Rubroshorea leprosula TaxID=152421 RepID=A0AAV5K8B6_9ROSI|nr:hypothetical protein SLEP1_g31563 [Rubroshorea leprosula]